MTRNITRSMIWTDGSNRFLMWGGKTRRRWAPFYLRGVLGSGERKSLLSMTQRLGLSGHDQLQHFVASPAWDDAPLWDVLAWEADRLVGGPEAFLMIDHSALPKKGHGVGRHGSPVLWLAGQAGPPQHG